MARFKTLAEEALSEIRGRSRIPIVAGGTGDLVGSGLVASLARPGGNITGLTDISPELTGKQVELLKEHRAQNPDEQVLRVIQITNNGISAGLRNSG